jgi:glucose/mannose-6-phosphate isomerase
MTNLDDASALGRLDPGGMLGQVAGMFEQLSRAAAAQTAFRAAGGIGQRPQGIRSVLVCGMGGSAIGGDIAAAWAQPQGVRIAVHRGYGLPAWVGKDTLVVFSSYSGNTEETLAAFDASAALGVPRLCIATGGGLARRGRDAGVPVYSIPGGLQPRAALGHSLAALLVLLHEAGLVADPLPELEAASRQLARLTSAYGPEVPEATNRAKRLARLWHGRLPVIYTGYGLTAPLGVRWRGQIQENAKSFATSNVFPELDHNEIMAWQALPELRRAALIVLLRDRDDGDAVARRMTVTAEILAPRIAAIEWIDTEGQTALERQMGAVALGDWASVYLAFLNGVDPTPVAEIETLKQRLAAASPA